MKAPSEKRKPGRPKGPTPIEIATGVRRGQIALKDVPEKVLPDVKALLRHPTAIADHARRTAPVPRYSRFLPAPKMLTRR